MTPPEFVAAALADLSQVETENQLREWHARWMDTETYQLHLDRAQVEAMNRGYDRKLKRFVGAGA